MQTELADNRAPGRFQIDVVLVCQQQRLAEKEDASQNKQLECPLDRVADFPTRVQHSPFQNH